MRRVVLTGAGCITAIGSDVSTFQRNLFAGNQSFCEIPDVRPGDLRFTRVARVLDFDPAAWLLTSQRQIAERSSAMAIAAARQAIAQSGVTGAYPLDDVAVVLGCSTAGRSAEEPETAKLYTKGGRVHPLTVPRSMGSTGTSLVCMEHGITGPAFTLNTACASATHAIGQAFHLIRSGSVRAAVTGGHEAPLTYGFLKAWDSLHVVTPTVCKPFAADRDGMTLGEGAAIFTLETMDAAIARGATILAEITGFGMSSDAQHMTHPHPNGPAAAMQRALRDANLQPEDIDYINAHGTGTLVNDQVEAEALHLVFGEHALTLPISSTKGLHGHAIGASGAMEVLATALALQTGTAPANACSGSTPDSTLRLGGILQENGTLQPRRALSNSFAFGGLNAVLALRRFEET